MTVLVGGGTKVRWAVQWRSENKTDGYREYLFSDGCACGTQLFETRAAARAFIEYQYAFLRDRPDLKREPHGWKMPRPVRVSVTVAIL